MSTIRGNDLEKIYSIQKKIFKYETSYLTQHFVLLFFFLIIIILYVNLTLNIDFSSWELSKCNPKYLFISGYIKKNPGYNATDTTVMNFWDCLISTNPGQFSPVNFLKDIIGKKKHTEDDKNDIIRRIKKNLADKQDLDTINKNKVNSYKNIDLLKVKDISTKYYLLSIYLKEYLNNILTYILSKFIIKFEKTKKRSELYIKEQDLSGVELETYKSVVDASLNRYKENSYLLNDLIKSNLDRNKL
tara:strand:- start:8476 stop:9210 length:735 start_codon:yes stop_codon:yes gene_type:complete